MLKNMTKVGKDIVTEVKAVDVEAADLYKNVLKPMLRVCKAIVLGGMAVDADSAYLYRNTINSMCGQWMHMIW